MTPIRITQNVNSHKQLLDGLVITTNIEQRASTESVNGHMLASIPSLDLRILSNHCVLSVRFDKGERILVDQRTKKSKIQN